ncbi:MAG TPA: ATP-binding cassette domain-containing protein [Thermomicrobiales bacterium]|nr:ATP-binding cassette domain-containing protein [Thermomicrobiales bacterium]
MIDLRGLHYRYPGASIAALRGIDWSVAEGEFAVVAGPSGSGKSTLLRCLNGLIPHLSGGQFGGTAIVGGHDVARYGPRTLSRVTGFVFQDPDGQAVAATVEDEIAFSMEQLGVSPTIMRKRVEEMLDLLGVAALRHRAVPTLSGGERQRVAIAAAMALHPALLVLDEPTSQLDPWGADDVMTALERLNADLSVTIVIAEHRLDRLLPLMDTLTWMEDGGIGARGVLDEIAPALPETALPPMVRLAQRLGIRPIPRTIKGFKRTLNGWAPPIPVPDPPCAVGGAQVRAQNVRVRIDGQTLLNGVDLTLRGGEIVALMGRNGSGKTTLLRTLFGFVKPECGRIEVAGLDMGARSPAELGARAAYLPQRSGSVLFNETVRSEIEFTVRHRGGEWPEWIVDALGLAELLDRDPRDLSEGQRLRAALAAVLAGEPRVVLLDEPTRGMDGDQKHQLALVLRELRARGVCVLLATHDVELAASLADRIVLLGHGEVIADGTPQEVMSGSMAFSTQINRLFGPGYLTLADVDIAAVPAFGDNSGRLTSASAIAASG